MAFVRCNLWLSVNLRKCCYKFLLWKGIHIPICNILLTLVLSVNGMFIWFLVSYQFHLERKNNKYGKHWIQNNLFIQRPVDLGEEWTPSDVVCCQCVFKHLYVHVWVAVCLHWTFEMSEKDLHTLGPGTLGEEEERSTHTLRFPKSVCVQVVLCVCVCDTGYDKN